MMMAEWESAEERKALWQQKARTLPPRQRAVYELADAVVHISAADSALERRDFNRSSQYWRVLRMSPRGMRVVHTSDERQQQQQRMLGQQQGQPRQQGQPGQQQGQQQGQHDGEGEKHAPPVGAAAGAAAGAAVPSRIGFMGNGATPTNHLSVEWFLREAWPPLRAALPGVRLRLVGYAPDDRPKKLQGRPCDAATSAVRCGWAWQTPYAGAEAGGGIDELGFISDDEMVEELLR